MTDTQTDDVQAVASPREEILAQPASAPAKKVETAAEPAAKPVAAATMAESAAEAPAPKRRGRKPRAAQPETAPAPAEAAPSEQGIEDAPKPARRRGRPRKVAAEETAASGPADEKPLSPEIAAARALSRVSQAEVARKERERQLALDGEDAAPAPAPRRRKPAAAAEPVAAGEPAASPAAAPAAAPAPLAPPTMPLIDPSLRPHRRGRKPKAYIEAERAAAAALAEQQAAYQAQLAAGQPQEGPVTATPAPVPAPESVPATAPASAPAPETAPREDVRPGRRRRAKANQERDQRDAQRDVQRDPKRPEQPEAASQPKPANADAAPAEEAERGRKHRNQDRQRDRFDRKNRNQDRKNRNQDKPVQNEPSLTRDDLAAMKVAELREKAKELEIDHAGKKKAELVEEIYRVAAEREGFREIEGILDIDRQGCGNIRAHGYMPSRDDAFVSANLIRNAGLRPGDLVAGTLRPQRPNDKLPGLAKITSVNGRAPEEARRRPRFNDLTPIYPQDMLKMETDKGAFAARAIDLVAPIGKGQRGLIVSPPKAGKTTMLKAICRSIAKNNPEVHLICLLVDERPEEVTDMRRSIEGEVVASTFDMPADNHTRVSELVIERAKRLVEMGEDVVVVLDSLTRLARAYNIAAPVSGRILSGGVDSAALYPPKKFLGAARNIENGGSLTILASALVETGSKMDEVIFEEFKGTGNMELKLSRDLADRRIFPAIDPVQSGTRNENLLLGQQDSIVVSVLRQCLAKMGNTERSAEYLIMGLKKFDTNTEVLQAVVRGVQSGQQNPW